MADETFVEQVVVQGTQDAKKQFDDLGNAGEKAFDRIANAAASIPDAGKAASDAFDRITKAGRGINEAAANMGLLSKETRNSRDNLKQFLPQTQQTQTAMQRLGRLIQSVSDGFRGQAKASDDASAATGGIRKEVTEFGHALAVLGRVTTGQGGELTHFAHIVTGLGRAFAVVAPGLLALGLGKIASTASDAAGKMADLASQLRLTNAATAVLNSVGIATGVTGDKLAASLKSVNTLIKDTADKDDAAAAATRTFNQQLEDGRDTYRKTAQGLDDVAKQQLVLVRGFGDGTTTAQQYIDGMDALAKQAKSVREELAKQDETERRLIREHQLAEIAAIQNGTALQKLGISALDANGKLKKAPEVLLQIADALHSLPAGTNKTEIEFDLIAAGLDRRLIPALRQGSVAFQQIAKDTKEVDPGFTDKDIAIADKYSVAIGLVAAAWDGLMNELGLGIAPAFTETLTAIKDLIISIKPGLVEFGTTVANFVAPIITGLAQALTNIVVPALKGFFAILQLIADGINAAFGTNVSGMQIFVAVLVAIAGAFGGVFVAATLVVALIGVLVGKLKEAGVNFSAVGDIASQVWQSISQGAVDLIKELTDGWNGWITFFQQLWAGIVGIADAVWTSVTSGAQGAVNFIIGIWQGLRDGMIQAFTEVRDFVVQVWSQIKQQFGAIFGSGDASAVVPIPKKAGGGPIRGPGTGISDSIPIYASNGEFMIRAAAVKKYGVQFFNWLNSMQFNPNAMGFAMGGLISAGPPRTHFAEGGLVQKPGNTLNLTIGTEQFLGLRADDTTMDQLERFAIRSQVRSAGRKPTWKR